MFPLLNWRCPASFRTCSSRFWKPAASQLALPGFVQDVQQPLLETGFPPELLELELTESAFVGDFAAASRTFRNLRTSTGVNFAVDDFGTGQSSLSYLHQLPFQRLKIDQSFIRG